MKKFFDRLSRDDGFTLVEALAALTVLSIAIVLTITPVLAGLNVLSDAKLATIASNLAQGRVEELRSLEYEEIGFPLGVPEGILQASETVTAQKIDFIVTTDVKYFGSINGLGEKVVPQGGDGVEGLPDMGINYKEVTVTVSHHAGAVTPVVMQTIVAPPNIAAHEGKSNIIVELIKEEPATKPPSAVGYPQVFLVRDTSPFIPFGGTLAATQTFAGVPASGTGATDYYYYARLGATLTSYEAANGWRIHPTDIDIETDRVHMGPTETATVPLRIYRPAEIVVELFDDSTLLPILVAGELTVVYEGTPYTFNTSDPEWTGTAFHITELGGAPVVPGSYDMTATALGYSLETRTDVVVPEDYPTDVVHEEAFYLELSTDAFLDVQVVDDSGTPISGASVTIDPESEAPFTLITDSSGWVSYSWAYDDFDVVIDVTSPHGHDPGSDFISDIEGVNVRVISLTAPANTGVITFHEDQPWRVQYFRYRPDGGAPDDWTDVYPNASGEATVTVDAGAWDVQKVCTKLRWNGNPRTRTSTVNVSVGGNVFWSSSKDCPWVPAP
jgi:prepilin-type N-terminal cleavage/methylation domain-containing protein